MLELTPPPLPKEISEALPFPRRRVVVDGYRIHFLDAGEGMPVLFVHGNPTWSYLWRKVIKRLQGEGIRCIAPDLVGFGLSDHPRSLKIHTLEFHGNLIFSFVETLGLSSFLIVGQDWGGPIASWIGVRDPKRIRGAVFLNTSLRAPRSFSRTTPFHRLARTPILSEILFLIGNFPLPFLSRVQGDRGGISSQELAAYRYPFRRIQDRFAPLALARMVPHRGDHPSVPPLRRIESWSSSFSGPVALIWGVRDPILGHSLSSMRRLFPHAHVVETPGGHFLQEEYPDEIAQGIVAICKAAF